MKDARQLLVPRPQEAVATAETFDLGGRDPAKRPTIAVAVASGIAVEEAAVEAAALRVRRELARFGRPPVEVGDPRAAGVRLILDPRVGADQGTPDRRTTIEGYLLAVRQSGITIEASAAPGLFYGAGTLAQWIRIHGEAVRHGRLPGLEVRDRPAFQHRGVMLDISRNKVPKLSTLRRLIDLLADLKYNQLQLYMEHTFAYRNHQEVWRHASPLRAGDIRRLEGWCRERFIELVPNQNSFGHFHRWLIHPAYRELAESPEGIEHPFSPEREPFSLCPLDPRSLELLSDLYDQLLPNFSSRLFNVGLDETFDLGLGRSAEACARKGRERVYLDFLKRVHELVVARGRRMLFWGDIILNRPQLIAELPRDAVALEWGYEADHPFAADCRHFADSGLEFWVCPGTSSWNSFAGRTTNALANLASAAIHGRFEGARGYLVTDWGDNGHLQPLVASYPGLAAGAAYAWNTAAAADVDSLPLARLLDLHVFDERAAGAGEAVVGLGDAYRFCGAERKNGSPLFDLALLPHAPEAERRFRGMTAEHLERTLEHIDRAAAAAEGVPIPDGAELAWMADALRFSCRLGQAWLEVGFSRPLSAAPARRRRELERELTDLAERLPVIWRRRNRPGGLEDSVRRLLAARELLLA